MSLSRLDLRFAEIMEAYNILYRYYVDNQENDVQTWLIMTFAIPQYKEPVFFFFFRQVPCYILKNHVNDDIHTYTNMHAH